MARATETTGVPAGEDDLHCQILVLKCMAGLMDTMVLNCAVNLKIFDAIHRHGGQPISLPDLAAALPASRVHRTVLRRVMRYLANMCLIDLQHPGTNAGNGEDGEYYSLTPAAATYLRVESDKSLVPFLRLNMLEEMITPLFAIDACVTAELGPDVPAVELLGREKFFSVLERDPEKGKIFNEAMTAVLRRTAEAVVEGCPAVFEGVETVVDVGGGEGLMAAAIASAFPAVKCVVLDLPHVVEKAPEREGVEFVAGDMFVSLPQADALLFTRVLHNWKDDKVIETLKRCRQAIDDINRKVLIIDMVIDEFGDEKDLQRMKCYRDIQMMAYLGGKQRTEKEWRSLLSKAEFTNCTFIRLTALEHLIEARP
ncbi:(RS)-norcoclaurine 6-O-methyltransferase [Apostasia shenzhenica]|uniref:(RS)-norcoclaurine 6-O-methyltransferase n=1 Tax=Apostasia shenzhenica TaxID=1088818 RepID=A0A2H9ZXN3_9ASPA|nr:(RS)-norcoclaurine 6-O-methyltransferase [Apostasia shenzhenica]